MHRSHEIRNNSSFQDWRYIPSDLNVADGCGRDVKFNDLSNNHRWITGHLSIINRRLKLSRV